MKLSDRDELNRINGRIGQLKQETTALKETMRALQARRAEIRKALADLKSTGTE